MDTKIRVSTESRPWRRKFSCCSCRDLNLQPFNHEFGTQATELSPPEMAQKMKQTKKRRETEKEKEKKRTIILNRCINSVIVFRTMLYLSCLHETAVSVMSRPLHFIKVEINQM